MCRESARASVASAPLIFICFLLTSCSSSSPGGAARSSTDPTGSGVFSVVAVQPANGATGVKLATAITITFSSAADPSTVNTTNIHLTAPSPVSGTVAYSAGSDTATFAPASLDANSTYTLTISGIKSSSGAAMASTFTSNFATVTTTPVSASIGPCFQTLMTPAPFQCVEYLSQMSAVNNSGVSGTIVIDNSGHVWVGFGPATANTVYTVQFCPAYNANSSAGAPACFDVGTISADASGAAKSILTFPRSGSWAGDFQIISGSTVVALTTWPAGNSQNSTMVHADFMALELQPATTVNGAGITNGSKIQDPLAGGEFWFSGGPGEGTADFALYGAPPNTSFDTYESVARAVDGSEMYMLGTFTTDASGNWEPLTAPLGPNLSGNGGDIFLVEPQDQTHAGWIGGFSVP